MSEIAAILGGFAGLVASAGLLWQKVIRPGARIIYLAEESLPVLLDIAQEFKPNNGKSLVDRMTIIEGRLDDISGQLEVICVERQ
ncbi:MAG: hypothetical protein ACE5F5_13525 [Acidimicrobiia bacterium]